MALCKFGECQAVQASIPAQDAKSILGGGGGDLGGGVFNKITWRDICNKYNVVWHTTIMVKKKKSRTRGPSPCSSSGPPPTHPHPAGQGSWDGEGLALGVGLHSEMGWTWRGHPIRPGDLGTGNVRLPAEPHQGGTGLEALLPAEPSPSHPRGRGPPPEKLQGLRPGEDRRCGMWRPWAWTG